MENSNDNFSFHKPTITVDDFILFTTYSAIFYQYVEFNYGNKDRSPLENVKFYRNDKSAKLTDDEVSILGYIRHSDDLPIRRRPLSILSRSSSVVTTKHKVLPEKGKADSFHIWCKSSLWLGESKLFISALLHSNGPDFTYFLKHSSIPLHMWMKYWMHSDVKQDALYQNCKFHEKKMRFACKRSFIP